MMPNEQPYNFKLGFVFAFTAIFFWGMLPVALKLSAAFIDPVSLTWFRFVVAFVISLAIQYLTARLVQFKALAAKDWMLLTFAAGFSMTNYITFVYCLDYLAPGPAQLNFQTAPFFLAFGGVLFFKERLNTFQMTCFATLALGMMLFFHPYLDFSNQQSKQVWVGVLLVQFSALSWTCYALLQKTLIKKLSPGNVLLYIYGAGLVLMLPFSDLSVFVKMDSTQWIITLFCAINTLIAYGSFGQAMMHWPTAQVGATIALTPIFSFTITALVVALNWWPEVIVSNEISLLGIIGILVVIGSVLCVQMAPVLANTRLRDWRKFKKY